MAAILDKATTQPINPISSVTGDGSERIMAPFTILVTIEGSADLLFHRWSDDEVAEKAAAAKGSKAKKTDNISSYVYRDAENRICLPGRYLQRSIVEAARFHQDPRSTRKMAKDLVQAGVLVAPMISPVIVHGKAVTEWDYLDRQRVMIQRSAISRIRPAFAAGWQARFEITSILPEYVTPPFLHRLVEDAGRFVGVGDFPAELWPVRHRRLAAVLTREAKEGESWQP